MTIGQLIDELNYLIECDGLSEDTEVCMASQPNWPFRYTLGRSVGYSDKEDIVYLEQGSQDGYLSDEGRECVGW